MAIKKIFTPEAPAPIGPYSQAILIDGKFLFTAGQIPIDPATGNVIEGDIKDQTRQVLKNLEAVLKAGGASMKSVVKATVFLTDMHEFSAMNEVYSEFLDEASPARSTIEVSNLPRNVHVEIEVVAIVG